MSELIDRLHEILGPDAVLTAPSELFEIGPEGRTEIGSLQGEVDRGL